MCERDRERGRKRKSGETLLILPPLHSTSYTLPHTAGHTKRAFFSVAVIS